MFLKKYWSLLAVPLKKKRKTELLILSKSLENHLFELNGHYFKNQAENGNLS
jgi:hypothetical protein